MLNRRAFLTSAAALAVMPAVPLRNFCAEVVLPPSLAIADVIRPEIFAPYAREPVVFLPPSVYDAAVREKIDLRGYVKQTLVGGEPYGDDDEESEYGEA
jgi:hypothetical protein